MLTAHTALGTTSTTIFLFFLFWFVELSDPLRWESALQFLQSMSSTRCLPDTVSCTAAMNACAKARSDSMRLGMQYNKVL